MLVEVRIPLRHRPSSAYAKVERRVGDWAVAAAGAAVTLDNGSIAAARVGLTAVNADAGGLRGGLRSAVGEAPTEDMFAEAGRRRRQACEPVADMRGSADYKRHLAGELTIRTLRTAVERVRSASAEELRRATMQVTMTVNGEQVTAEVEPRMLLVHFLRDQLQLTGTHWGCDTSNCGTCVVDVDGEPVKSCTMLAAMASGHERPHRRGPGDRRHPRPRAGGLHAMPRVCSAGSALRA